MSDSKMDVLSQTAQATPSLTAVLLWIGQKDIDFWLGFSGIVFIALQAAYMLWKWRRDVRNDRAGIPPVKD